MKHIIILLILACVGFVSCDGRKSKSVALKESIEEFNQKQSKMEIVTFYPKEYTEVVTDTLLANKVNVRIKNHSLPKATVPMVSGTANHVTLHRVFESEITVSRDHKTIFNGRLSAAQLNPSPNDAFWSGATLQHAWLNEALSTTETVQVDVSFINPKEKSYKLYRMSIDADGHHRIRLIDETS